MRFKLLFFLALFSLIHWPGSFCSANDLPAEFAFARYGNDILATFRFTIPPDYHAYANDPGGSGLPTSLDFNLDGEGQMPVLYPAGIAKKDVYDPRVQVNTYTGDVCLLSILPSGSTGRDYTARLNMLLCSSKHCRPYKRAFSGSIPKFIPLLADVPWAQAARELLDSEDDSSGALTLEEGQAPPPKIASEAQKAAASPAVRARMAEPDSVGKSHIEVPENFDLSLKPRYATGELEIFNLAKALLVGILAGLLLNAMPCVLPVLTLKVSGLLWMADSQDRKGLIRFREHNLCFAAGILSLFTVLALVLGLADLMWGQLYQNQAVLLVMLILVFLMGLSMLGVFTLPAFDLRLDRSSRPMLNSFFTGFISTFLATPCSGPLLGGVLAWAFTQSLPVLLAVFWAVGLGMSLPYFVFCIWPSFVKILPRPGNWMYVFEHILGFLLLGTALYLLSILPEDKHIQTLCVLLLVALCAWLWGKFCGPASSRLRRNLVGSTALALLFLAVIWILQPPARDLEWQEFSPEAFREDLGKKNMLVEFTADWCPNCKFLEATVLSGKKMQAWQKKYGLELVKVDLTEPDEFADRLLDMLGSKSIPLTAIFPRGSESSSPLVLRDLYGSHALGEALEDALGDDGWQASR